MSVVTSDLLVVTGAHDTIRERVKGILSHLNAWDRTDLVGAEGSALALADTNSPYHEGMMMQVETATRLHFHPGSQILLVGPTDWGSIVKKGVTPSRKEEEDILWAARENLLRIYPDMRGRIKHILLDLDQLRRQIVTVVKSLVIGCLDPRCLRCNMQTAENRDLGGRAHLCTLAGATGAITDERTQWLVFDQVEQLKPEKLGLYPHWDCGFHNGSGSNPRAHKAHFRKLKAAAELAIQYLRVMFPWLAIDCQLFDPIQQKMLSFPLAATA